MASFGFRVTTAAKTDVPNDGGGGPTGVAGVQAAAATSVATNKDGRRDNEFMFRGRMLSFGWDDDRARQSPSVGPVSTRSYPKVRSTATRLSTRSTHPVRPVQRIDRRPPGGGEPGGCGRVTAGGG